MPAMQAMVHSLNAAFGRDSVRKTAKLAGNFAPGRQLDLGSFLAGEPTQLQAHVLAFAKTLPASFKESLRAVIHHALTAARPIPISFVWAPGYDYEMTIWDAPDTKATRGGITILLKTRYPDDKHPLARKKGKKVRPPAG